MTVYLYSFWKHASVYINHLQRLKLKHWRGFSAIFALESAPMLEFATDQPNFSKQFLLIVFIYPQHAINQFIKFIRPA